jgi:hypothetical protein
MVIVSKQQTSNDISRIARSEHPDELQFIDVTNLSRYDLLLAMIPLSLLAAWVAGHALGLPEWVALGIGALAAFPALLDGLALNPPA